MLIQSCKKEKKGLLNVSYRDNILIKRRKRKRISSLFLVFVIRKLPDKIFNFFSLIQFTDNLIKWITKRTFINLILLFYVYYSNSNIIEFLKYTDVLNWKKKEKIFNAIPFPETRKIKIWVDMTSQEIYCHS
jgi:hypothetical protein